MCYVIARVSELSALPKFKIEEDEIQRIILALMQTADVMKVVSKLDLVEEDPKDNMVIETAFDGNVDFIVSGDDYLLALKSFDGIKIVNVKQMFEALNKFNP